ncbi:chemotaxis protein CheD [Pontibacillus halophilus JSM 076056 = DSM 19796]|uniref:Probable chemoreceptor glutamine deamidase CheD n=1 Tax=Pontibacillus halophilus JSM 076056 = DSM 19796 TaxID=1385510 RepID=A0A0A5GME8_9BACI|nr:chemotaxis protein CheD [Pontibacillus halophilus]KGX93149.1 chemotaxis protein CheD [Pontibacillus halophilus JSM 076056 = DSM 19796]
MKQSYKNVIKVGIADLQFVESPNTIRTSGLGSCVGIILFDERLKLGGMAHIMLPDSKANRAKPCNRAKYADTAIDDLFHKLLEKKAATYRLKAKIAGGAQMFAYASSSDVMRIGERNIEAVKEKLSQLKIPIVAEDTGGNSGRTIEFDPEDASLMIRTVNKGVITI